MRRRKVVTVRVTVSAPAYMSVTDIRREMRFMKGVWAILDKDIKIHRVRAVKRGASA